MKIQAIEATFNAIVEGFGLWVRKPVDYAQRSDQLIFLRASNEHLQFWLQHDDPAEEECKFIASLHWKEKDKQLSMLYTLPCGFVDLTLKDIHIIEGFMESAGCEKERRAFRDLVIQWVIDPTCVEMP